MQFSDLNEWSTRPFNRINKLTERTRSFAKLRSKSHTITTHVIEGLVRGSIYGARANGGAHAF